MQDSSSVWFTLRDHLGSTRIVLNQSNTVVASYDYDPYGKKFRSSVNTNTDYQFTGQEYDDEILLHNYRARMYDHDVAQFYAIDPASQFFNSYSYAANNPVVFTDPTGMVTAGYWEFYAELVAIQQKLNARLYEIMMGGGGGGSGAGWSPEYGGAPPAGLGWDAHVPSQTEINSNPEVYGSGGSGDVHIFV